MRPLLLIAYVSPLLLVSQCLSAAAATAKAKPRKDAALTLEQFRAKLMAEGKNMQLPQIIAKVVELPLHDETRSLVVDEKGTSDARYRKADLLLLREPDGTLKPATLHWSMELREDGRETDYDYRTALDGSLEKAIRLDVRLDENGKPVKGSGSLTRLDVASKEVRDEFQDRILGFWLKGRYRAKPRAKK